MSATITPITETECCGNRTLEAGHNLAAAYCPRCDREAWRATGYLWSATNGEIGFFFRSLERAERFDAKNARR